MGKNVNPLVYKAILPLVIFSLITLSLFLGIFFKPRIDENDEERNHFLHSLENYLEKAPAFNTFDGKKIRFSEIKAPFVIMTFFSSNCPPCLGEIPFFVKLSKKYPPSLLQVLAINTNNDGLRLGLLKQRLQINYPLVVDLNNHLSDLFRIRTTPTTLLIYRGEIQIYGFGPIDQDDFENRISSKI